MRNIALIRKSLVLLASLVALSVLGGPSTTFAASTSISATPSAFIYVPDAQHEKDGTWYNSGVTLAQDVQPRTPPYTESILISDQSLLRVGWMIRVKSPLIPPAPDPPPEYMLIEQLIDGAYGNPDTMVVERGMNGSPAGSHLMAGTLIKSRAVTADIYANGVTDSWGLGGFQVFIHVPSGMEYIKMTAETTWVASTGRDASWCDPDAYQYGDDIWGVSCSTATDNSDPETGAQCLNAIDDDADTLVNDGCPVAGPATSETGTQCDNAVDDDADSVVNDGCPAAPNPETGDQCDNTIDDDADTVVNDGCPAAGPPKPETGTQCDYAIDDDADGVVNDGCPQVGTDPESGNQCVDAIDDDGDGKVNDGCPAEGPPASETGAQCANAIDDDADTVVNDGCPVAGPPTSETGAQCGNNLDDDADTLVNDGCPAAPEPESWTTQCANAIDDDADTVVNDGCPVGQRGPTGSGVIAKVTLLPSQELGLYSVTLTGSQLTNAAGDTIPATLGKINITVMACPDANLDGYLDSGDLGQVARNMGDRGVDSGTTLVAQVNASQTNMQVSDQSLLLPILPYNTISIDAEQMTLQALQEGTPDTMTVARAINLTPAKPHNAGAHIYRATYSGPDGKYGYTGPRDINKDGYIDSGDLGLVARTIVTKTTCPAP